MEQPKEPPTDEDEVLSFLARIERLLLRLNEGVLLFIFKKIPKWIYEVFEALVRHFREYFDWVLKIAGRVGRIIFFLLSLTGFLFGPPFGFSYFDAPLLLWVSWFVLIILALLYALRRYVKKEIEFRRHSQEGSSTKLVCSSCNTLNKECSRPPDRCVHCGVPWNQLE